MVAIVVMLVSGRGLAPPDEVRFKGGAPQFTLFVSSAGDAARPLERGDTLRSGDVIRFGVVAPRPAHAFVASIDERGTFTRYFPSSQRASAPLDGREYLQVLPGSVRLDDSAGLEWIVLVLSATALPQERVEEALRAAWRDGGGGALGPVALDAELRVVQVRKVAP